MNKFDIVTDQPDGMTKFFPFPEFRKYQRETVEDVEKHLTQGVENVIVEMPTGSGKSAIAVSAGLWSNHAYCLTSQKILQDQYIRDFAEEHNVSVLKGRGNYECTFLGNPAKCDECYTPARKECYAEGLCLYKNAKMRTAASPVALMNYSYFLNVVDCDPQQIFRERKLLICDEAHSIETELMNQIEFLLSEFLLKRLGYHVNVPTLKNVEQYSVWIKEHLHNLQTTLKRLYADLADVNRHRMSLSRTSNEFKQVSKDATELTSRAQELDRLVRRMNTFIQTLNSIEWVFSIEKTEKKKFKRVVFRPLTVDFFANDALLKFGKQRIYMSATILDQKSFCKSLGINHDNSVFLRVPSTFPPKNRRIIFTDTGYMNLKQIEATLPHIVTDVNKALEYHKEEKGLIHCNSYKIANYIENNCWDDRLLFHTSADREQVLKRFMESIEPLVLVSPSMTEGLDLKGDLARWEIIVKIPYPYLGDKQIAKRMEMDPDWYNWQTALKLVQSYGRIFRAEDDWGTAYIFDKGAQNFIYRNKSILPQWFLDAM